MSCKLLVQIVPIKVLSLTTGWEETSAGFLSGLPELIRILNVQNKCWGSATAITGRKKEECHIVAHVSLKKLWCQETKYASTTIFLTYSSLGVARGRSFLPLRPPQSWEWGTRDCPHDSSVKVLDFPKGRLQLHVYSFFQSVSITKIKDRKTEFMLIIPEWLQEHAVSVSDADDSRVSQEAKGRHSPALWNCLEANNL